MKRTRARQQILHSDSEEEEEETPIDLDEDEHGGDERCFPLPLCRGGVHRCDLDKQTLIRILLIVLVAVVMALVALMTEGYFRRNAPESTLRPSALLGRVADAFETMFRWLGWQLGRIVDIYEWIRDILIDASALLAPIVKTITSPIYIVAGWCDYFHAAYVDMSGDYYWVVMILSLVVLVSISCATWHFGNFVWCKIKQKLKRN